MESEDEAASGLLDAIVSQLDAMISHLPDILTVVLILTAGWIVARLARRVVRRIGTASNQWLVRVFPSGMLSGARMSSWALTFVSEIVFWAAILIAVTIAANSAELGSVSQWLDRITAQLPNFIAGIGIVVVGYFLGVFVRGQFLTQASATSVPSNALIGRLAQVAVVSIGLIIGLDQVGIDVALLIGLAVVITAGILTALAVAFASGARTYISNFIGIRSAHANLSAGMTIQVGDIQGEVVEFTPTLIALETEKGRVLVPGRLFDEAVITVISPVNSEEGRND